MIRDRSNLALLTTGSPTRMTLATRAAANFIFTVATEPRVPGAEAAA